MSTAVEWKESVTVRRETARSYRILCLGETWFGSDARAAFAALRRLGNSTLVLDSNHYVPLQWQTILAKGVRKLLRPVLVRELMLDVYRALDEYRPHCLFVFKGNWVHPEIINRCRQRGIATVNYYPDVSVLSHGPYIPRALPLYDQVFTTKSYGLQDMKERLGVRKSSFLPPGYDPELHKPLEFTVEEAEKYSCDVAFIGTWSRKKELLLSALREAMRGIHLRIWGCQWEKSRSRNLADSIMRRTVTGDEYTKAICGASICLGLLSEKGKGSSSGDLITARTFQIPACGTLMLHERNAEVLRYFEEEKEAAFFGSVEELVEKISFYLAQPDQRRKVALNGLFRSLQGDYSIDNRMKVVVEWLDRNIDSLAINRLQ